jgi:ADP-ribosylglycohydrolase
MPVERIDWRAIPMLRHRALNFTHVLPPDGLTYLRHGFKPTDMNHKWFVFFEDGKLFAHRSWTGFQIYQLSFRATRDGATEVGEVHLNDDPEQYTGDDAEASQTLAWLLEWFVKPEAQEESGRSLVDSSPTGVPTRERFRGALLGLAVGDALGTTVEFSPPGTFPPVTDIKGGGPFHLPAGAWTDDTSMALCLAESLLDRGAFDPVDQLERYIRWYRTGHLSSTGTCFDIGNATRAALERFERTREPYPGDHAPRAAGNGVLMRLAPIALTYVRHPDAAIALAAASARTTHGSPKALDAARYFAGLLLGAIAGKDRRSLLGSEPFEPRPGLWDEAPLDDGVAEVARGSFMSKHPPSIKGGGYVVQALEAALWALFTTETFEDGVLAAVNLGDDADTTGAIFGQLAGALYGVDSIPPKWTKKLVMADLILDHADRLYVLASAIEPVDGDTADVAVRPSHPVPIRTSPVDSYWVLDQQLLAGPYPGSKDRNEARAKLTAFLDAGVTVFVDLTEEGEGPPLRPYSKLLAELSNERGGHTSYVRLPVRDVDVPKPWEMRAILSTVGAALAADETVYVHCWGGVGRTGTFVGCFLMEAGSDPTDVLAQIARLRHGTKRAGRASPETEAQRAFVKGWLGTAAPG